MSLTFAGVTSPADLLVLVLTSLVSLAAPSPTARWLVVRVTFGHLVALVR